MNAKEKKMIELFARRDGYVRGRWYKTTDGCDVEFIKPIEEDGLYNVFREGEGCDWKPYYTDENGKTAYGANIIPSNYLEDDSAILRLVRGLSKKECAKYNIKLNKLMDKRLGRYVCMYETHQATTCEMVEALYIALKASEGGGGGGGE